jgi:hypothetical protein
MRLVGKKNSSFGLEMRLKMSDQNCTYNGHVNISKIKAKLSLLF